jgi:hypothetical protein
MNEKQEIRAKALELTIATLALFPSEDRRNRLAKFQKDGIEAPQMIVNDSKIFEDFITGPK